MPPTPAALLGATSAMIATMPPNTATAPNHVDARRFSPRAATRPTTAPAAIASRPPTSVDSWAPSATAPVIVS